MNQRKLVAPLAGILGALLLACVPIRATAAQPVSTPTPEPAPAGITAKPATPILEIIKPAPRAVLVSAEVSAPGSHPPENLFSGKTFESRPDAHFVKVGFAFDPPLRASKIILESCSNEFRDGVEFYIFPGARRVYSEGGSHTVTASLEKVFVDEPAEIRSLAINFRHNDGVCIKSLKFRDALGEPVDAKLDSKFDAKLDSKSEAEKLSTEIETRAETRKAQFLAAGLEDVLDQELAINADDGKWIFRFRGDGTFFVYGYAEEAKSAGRFTALGEFECSPESGKNKLKITLKGRRLVTAEPWDGWLCGPACGERELARLSSIQETIVLEKLAKGGFMVRNRASAHHRALPFSDLKVRKAIP